MKLHVLGKTRQDKGKQLEYLTRSILEKREFTNIATRVISSGGNEIDVWAERIIDSLDRPQVHRIICECKAHDYPIDMPDWLKFLGKVYVEEKKLKREIHGCFIALSGANGNVTGNYDELRTHGQTNIELVTGNRLAKVVSEIYSLPKTENITKRINQFITRQILSIALCYYNHNIYWRIEFENEVFTLLNNRGNELDPNDPIIALAENRIGGTFISLQAEHEADLKRKYDEKVVLTSLMLIGGGGTLAQICSMWAEIPYELKKREDPHDDDMKQAISRLEEMGLLQKEGNLYQLLKHTTVEYIAELYRYFLDGQILSLAIGCPFYDNNITTKLLDHICKIQHDLVIPPEDREFCLKLLLWSPSALFISLHPIPMIVAGYRRNQNLQSEQANKYDVNAFMGLLYECFVRDYQQLDFYHYFFRKRDIRELDIMYIVKIKGSKMPILEKELRWRNAIVQMPEPKTDRVIYWQLPLTNDAPEPWDLEKEASKKTKQDHKGRERNT